MSSMDGVRVHVCEGDLGDLQVRTAVGGLDLAVEELLLLLMVRE